MRTPKLICFAVSAILAVTAAFADRLNPGQSLAVGGSITSPDGRFTLVLQADGNLVLYQSGGVARWATGTVGRTVSQAVMQADGNFVLYGPAGPIWATATDGHPGAYLAVQDDGNVVIYGPGGPLWAYSRLNPGQSLEVGGSVPSLDGRFTLVLQADGNLVLYQTSGAARWATDTVGRPVSKAVMQADGNFVLYGPAGPIWATATDGHPGAYLAVQDDGNVVIYGPGGPLWASRKNYVRRSINSLAPNGPEIAALRRGFQVMQSRQPSDHTSSIYQANMHGTVDRPLLADWETCQHGSFFFLSWHRMYLYYLERILRAASGDPYLSLPYWNYSDGADPNARALPLPFRQPQNATNSLYVPQRDPAINAGGQMPPSAVSLSALGLTAFSSFGGQAVAGPTHRGNSGGSLESTPHGVVHVLVGGSGSGCPGGGGWMSCFEFAARDPIFWLHHANIDRLWEQWLAQGGGRSNPTDQVWLTTQFEFFDENDHPVKLSGQQIVDTAGQLNYVYNENPWDRIAQVTPQPIPPTVPTTGAVPTGVASPISRRSVRQLGTSEVPAVELKREPVTVRVKLVNEEEFALRAPERAIVLEIEGAEFDQMPSGYYEIYLDLPEGEPPHFPSKYYVGNLAFFGVKPRGERHEGEKPPRFTYDITKIVDRLKSDQKWNTKEATVTFVKQDVIPPPGMRIERKVIPVTIRHVTITTE